MSSSACLASLSRLSLVAGGRSVRVIRVLHEHFPEADRLAALGVTPGATVTVLQTFPGIIFQCDQTEVAIEPEVARVIVVEIIER